MSEHEAAKAVEVGSAVNGDYKLAEVRRYPRLGKISPARYYICAPDAEGIYRSIHQTPLRKDEAFALLDALRKAYADGFAFQGRRPR